MITPAIPRMATTPMIERIAWLLTAQPDYQLVRLASCV